MDNTIKKYDLFGSSSFLFTIPACYSIYNLNNRFFFYKTALCCLPLMSYLCNTTYNRFYQLLDHLTTSSISLSYLFYMKKYTYFYNVLIFLLLDIIVNKKIAYSTTFSYIILNISSYRHLSRREIMISILSLIICAISYIKRNPYHPSYRLFTTVWHSSNSVLLLLSTNTLQETGL